MRECVTRHVKVTAALRAFSVRESTVRGTDRPKNYSSVIVNSACQCQNY